MADFFNPDSIYERHIKLNNYPFLEKKDPVLAETLASDVMQPNHHYGRWMAENGDARKRVKRVCKWWRVSQWLIHARGL